MRPSLSVCLLLICALSLSATDQATPQGLLTAKKVYLRNDSDDKKLFHEIADQVTAWGRWQTTGDKRAADILLVLSVRQELVNEIRLKSLEEPQIAKPSEYYELRTLSALDRRGRELASFSTRVGWTAARDAKELIGRFKDLISKAERKRGPEKPEARLMKEGS